MILNIMERRMDHITVSIERVLRRDIDSKAEVRPLKAALSPFLSGAYDLYEALLIGEALILARPRIKDGIDQGLIRRTAALAKTLNKPVALCLPLITRRQQRSFIKARQGFITTDGSYFLPQLALSLSNATAKPVSVTRPFAPAQQAVFLYCLQTDTDTIFQAEAQKALGISSGSASAAFSKLTSLELLEYEIGGKTGRKKGYRIKDKKRYFNEGIKHFGSAVLETITAPASAKGDGWLKTGLSALAELSDLLPPALPEYAVSREQVKENDLNPKDSETQCIIKVLKYDPRPLAENGLVDTVTMLLTIDEKDERISLALRQALKGQEWYQD